MERQVEEEAQMSRPPNVPRETLEPLLVQFRSSGLTAKAIARHVQYSTDHILKLCSKWGIKKQLKPKMTMDKTGVPALEYLRDDAPSANVPAASGSETRQRPDKGLSS